MSLSSMPLALRPAMIFFMASEFLATASRATGASVATPLVMRARSGTAVTEPFAVMVIERRAVTSSAEAADAMSAGARSMGKRMRYSGRMIVLRAFLVGATIGAVRGVIEAEAAFRAAERSAIEAALRLVGPVAQWLELAAHNRLVPGSNPGGPTNT